MKAHIDAKDFNRMIRNLKPALKKPGTSAMGRNDLTELIHLEFGKDQVKCVAIDGFRVHEEYIYATVDEEFSCHIAPPQLLPQAGDVHVYVEGATAYVEFDNIRLATKQPNYPLTVYDSGKILEMIGDDERFEVAVNPKYLLDAVSAVKGEKQIVLNIGSPLQPIMVYPTGAMGIRTYSILPVRRRYSEKYPRKSHEEQEQNRLKQLKFLKKKLENTLHYQPSTGSENSGVWEQMRGLMAALDEFFKEERTS